MKEKVKSVWHTLLKWNQYSESVSKCLTEQTQQNTNHMIHPKHQLTVILGLHLLSWKQMWELRSYENVGRALYWPRNCWFCQRNENILQVSRTKPGWKKWCLKNTTYMELLRDICSGQGTSKNASWGYQRLCICTSDRYTD